MPQKCQSTTLCVHWVMNQCRLDRIVDEISLNIKVQCPKDPNIIHLIHQNFTFSHKNFKVLISKFSLFSMLLALGFEIYSWFWTSSKLLICILFMEQRLRPKLKLWPHHSLHCILLSKLGLFTKRLMGHFTVSARFYFWA